MKAKPQYYCKCGKVLNSYSPSHIKIHNKTLIHKNKTWIHKRHTIQPYPLLWAKATIEEISSPTTKVPEVYEVKEYPQLWTKATIEDLRQQQEITIKIRCTITVEEKGAIINALKFKFLTNEKMKNMLKRNNYAIKITRGIHSSSAYGYHFNGSYVDKDTNEEKSATMHFNLLNFKWENIPCITSITCIR